MVADLAGFEVAGVRLEPGLGAAAPVRVGDVDGVGSGEEGVEVRGGVVAQHAAGRDGQERGEFEREWWRDWVAHEVDAAKDAMEAAGADRMADRVRRQPGGQAWPRVMSPRCRAARAPISVHADA